MIDWYWLVPAVLAGGIVGYILESKLRTDINWLGVIGWLVGEKELEAIARIIWQHGLVPFSKNGRFSPLLAKWIQVRFHDNEDEFVVWVLEQAKKVGLPPVESDQLDQALRARGLERRIT